MANLTASRTHQLLQSVQQSRAAPRTRRPSALQVHATASVRVAVEVAKHVAFGNRLKLVGDSLELGEWDVDRALDLSWSDGDIWKAQVELPPSTEVRFKFVEVHGDGVGWEHCDDRSLQVPEDKITVSGEWDAPELMIDETTATAVSRMNGAAADKTKKQPVLAAAGAANGSDCNAAK